MTTIYAKHEPYETGQLAQVVAEMRLAGPPTIRVMALAEGYYAALEGSHRLAAARYLNFGPKLVQLEPDVDWERPMPSLPAYEWETGECLLLRAAAF